MKKLNEYLGQATGYEEFKYIMQDSGSYYFGVKYAYLDLMQEELAPFKFKAVIEHYLAKETDLENTLESHLYYLEPDSFACRTYMQLKARVKVSMLVPKKHLFKKETSYVYQEKIMSISDLAEMNLARKKGSGLIIRELVISKLALMSFSV